MEGSIKEENIAETNVLSKGVTPVVVSSNASLIKTANGQTVLITGPNASTISSISSTPISAIIRNRSGNGRADGNNISSGSKHQTNDNKTVPTIAQAIAVSGGMSIVQLQLPNAAASNMVQSVIQPNHQSVIQAPNTATISTLQQLPKNVILLNKPPGQGSVIHSTESDHGIQLTKEGADAVNQALFEDESKRRREILARRPSYRKILNELSSTDSASAAAAAAVDEKDDDRESSLGTAISLPSYLKVLPASAIQLGTTQEGASIQGIPTIMTNANSMSGTSTIVQYATAGHDSQFIVPADLQAYQLRPSNQSGIAQNVVMTSTANITPQILDEASKKRELRLLKNREAAKECRRKKKEYIKCLENRVAVLENQNKALIDELKTLKELYCKKSE